MFYDLIKITVRLALRIFCSRIRVSSPDLLATPGPLLITANHPNSFLDAVIIGSRFRRPVHFLARGDAFSKPWHAKLLGLLNMIPVYRLNEGKENLALNEEAFVKSMAVLSSNGIVLIFIEGICKHTHALQPFKKGAARMAIQNAELKNFRVMPLGIAYDFFDRMGKQVNMKIGEPSAVKDLLPFDEEAKNMRYFNEVLHDAIEKKIVMPPEKNMGPVTETLFFVPAMLGMLLHFPLFNFIKTYIRKRTRGTVFFDSVLFGALLFIYPLYLLFIGVLLWVMAVPPVTVLVIMAAHPLLAWFSTQWNGAGRRGIR